MNLGRRWYLVGWDRRREDWRTFRVDRISRPAATGTRFATRTLPAKDAAAYVEQSIAGAGHRYEARVTVHAPKDEIAKRIPWVARALEPIDAQRCEYRTSDYDLEWLALRIASSASTSTWTGRRSSSHRWTRSADACSGPTTADLLTASLS